VVDAPFVTVRDLGFVGVANHAVPSLWS
jgi:hypothetical protein